ncbi:unnamed protein product [Ilex paraguariensis]|uniref:DCD domain-containing protein n=1 Tax=Ilex paraguariensis TaxID=185542 RepID=A0ABC8U2E1_9AQUA
MASGKQTPAQRKEAKSTSQVPRKKDEKESVKRGEQGEQANKKNSAAGKTIVSGKNKRKIGIASDSTLELTNSGKKMPTSLKPEPKILKKSSKQKPTKLKEAKGTPKVAGKKNEKKVIKGGKQETEKSQRDGESNLNSTNGNKGKELINEKHEEATKRDQNAEKNLGGLILMCNAKTKSDCFHYHVMGVTANKQELVMSIKPGLKLFLFDFDLKLLYGIYKASSAGGWKLEPAAFGGAFPVQVRFTVHKDCLPLPESVFKKAIKESYDDRTKKFKTELTAHQVKKLTLLFQAAPWLNSNAQSSGQESLSAPIIHPPAAATIPGEDACRGQSHRDHYSNKEAARNLMPSDRDRKQFSKHPVSPNDVASPDPLFLSEKDYRTYGLRGERHLLTAAATPMGTGLDPQRTDQEREQLLKNSAPILGDAALIQQDAVHLDPLFLSEKDYRTFGLQGRQKLPAFVSPTIEVYDPYHYSTNQLVDQYLSLPRTVVAPSESYSLTGRETYINGSSYVESETRNYPGRMVPDGGERSYSTYASHALSDYNQNYHQQLRGASEFPSTSVSSRYSFAGPPASYL